MLLSPGADRRFSRLSWTFFAAALLLLASAVTGYAQPNTSVPGVDQELRRQQQRLERDFAPPRSTGPEVTAPEREKMPPLRGVGPVFFLKGIKFDGGSVFLTDNELSELTARYTNKNVRFADLVELVGSINDLYAAKGFSTALATLPPQDVKAGVVTIKLTEGRVGEVKFEGNEKIPPDFFLSRIRAPKGEPLNVPQFSRDIVWFNRTHDAQLKAALAPGADVGFTDVILSVTEPQTHSWQLFSDNQGVSSVGRNQFGTLYKRSNFITQDDRLTFYGVKSVEEMGNINGNLSYNLPVNEWGGRLGVSVAQGHTRLIHGPYARLNADGRSQNASLNFSQPLIADQNWLVQFNLGTSYGNTRSYLSSKTTVDNGVARQSVGFSVSNAGENHSLSLTPTLVFATVNSRLLNTRTTEPIWTGSLAGFLRLPWNLSLHSLANGQFSSPQTTIGDLLFQIGGPTTVRGYPTNSTSGHAGWYANFELHWSVVDHVPGLDLFLFLDQGAVYSTFPKHTYLSSYGVGFSWNFTSGLSLEGSFAKPIQDRIVNQQSHEFYIRMVLQPLLLGAK